MPRGRVRLRTHKVVEIGAKVWFTLPEGSFECDFLISDFLASKQVLDRDTGGRLSDIGPCHGPERWFADRLPLVRLVSI